MCDLKGKWFLSFRTGKVFWQGEVLGALSSDRYLVQLFSWLDGSPTDQVIASLEQMQGHLVDGDRVEGWQFYDSKEDFELAIEKLNVFGVK